MVPGAVVLASRSPQRKALLEGLGLTFEVVDPNVTEETEGDARELVLDNARWKAASAAALVKPGALIIAGDTEVVLDGAALGQPRDEADARSFLERLSGREHEVIGGLALLGPGERDGGPEARQGVVASKVRFRELDEAIVAAYLASGEWEGRAGAYAVQGLGSALIDSVEGDLSNVIGLPIPLLLELEPSLGPQA